MTNNQRIIKYLIENNKGISIRQLSQELSVDYKTTHSNIRKLKESGIISLERFGNADRVSLIKRIHPSIFEAEYMRAQKILENKNILIVLNQFKKDIKEKQYIVLLFGSYAAGKQTKQSDIDLIFNSPKIFRECHGNRDKSS